jgi:hypothetical protein
MYGAEVIVMGAKLMSLRRVAITSMVGRR